MNKDFHYEATYQAAKVAGFTAKESAKIAHAAQSVDECVIGMKKERTEFVETMETNPILEGMLSYNKEDDAELIRLKKIWMPFHFLPGNFQITNGSIQNLCVPEEYTGGKTYKTRAPLIPDADYDEKRDECEFLCMCRHSSELVHKMINDTVTKYAVAKDADEKEKLLVLIGIQMHVLADTWAHEYFTGAPNWWINEAREFEKNGSTILGKTQSIIEGKELSSISGRSVYSGNYLGHARAGHYPDIPHYVYKYKPGWMNEASKKLERKNPKIFAKAFAQMVDAMKAIRTNQQFEFRQDKAYKEMSKEITDEVFCTRLKNLLKIGKDDQSDLWRAAFGAEDGKFPNLAQMVHTMEAEETSQNSEFSEYELYNKIVDEAFWTKLKGLLKTEQDDQSALWRKAFKINDEELPEYNVEKLKEYLDIFQTYAKGHQDMVLEYLGEKDASIEEYKA